MSMVSLHERVPPPTVAPGGTLIMGPHLFRP